MCRNKEEVNCTGKFGLDSVFPSGTLTPSGQTHCVCPNGLTAVVRFSKTSEQKQKTLSNGRTFIVKLMADREGFEPSVLLPVHTLSRRAHSTTLTPAR